MVNRLIILLALLIVAQTAYGDSSPKRLYGMCKKADLFLKGFSNEQSIQNMYGNPGFILIGQCLGYIEGAMSTLTLHKAFNRKPLLCLPKEGLTNKKAIGIVISYLEANDNRMLNGDDYGESALIVFALSQKYSCLDSQN